MKVLLSPWMAIITLILMLGVRSTDMSFIESVRLRYFDQLITSKGTALSERVHVVNIDDAYIRQKGQFPFPRGQYSSIIADLYRAGAGVVVFNIYMPDGDRFGQDTKLANTLRVTNTVLPHAASDRQSEHMPFRPGVSVIGGDFAQVGVKYAGIQPNTKQINDSATGIGIVNTLPEIDGVVRRVPMVVNVNGEIYPSISLETIRVAAGDPSFQVKVDEGTIQAVRVPQFGKIPTDAYGRIWIDWSSKPIEHSMSSLPKSFDGGIVVVGLTAMGLNNPISSAVGEIYPHYLQAAVLDTIISGNVISRPDWSLPAELGLIILTVVLSISLTRFTHGYIFAILLGATTYYASMELFLRYGYLLDAVFPILTIGICSFHGYIVKFLVELRQKLQVKKQFGTYLSPALVEKLQKNPELLTLGGESRELSIMFTDVRGFTTISEHYGKDVQGLTKIMNRYMTAMTAKIIENNGTLDKYIGDAQMAFWNAPLDEPNHAKMAVKTALQMMESLNEFNAEITTEGIPAFGMGLGINTDVVVVGNMGSDQRFDYTCLGDGVNLSSRLEGQSKNYGVRIILGPRTAMLVRSDYAVTELDCIAVKGKNVGVKIYTIAKTDWKHELFLDSYYAGDWDIAKVDCKNLMKNSLDLQEYYGLMLDRLNGGIPADWDGVYRATSK